ncbi:MAG: hypothetical protein ACOYOS_23370 [Syntrophales bacterium]
MGKEVLIKQTNQNGGIMGELAKANAGDILRCKMCGHSKELTSDIIETLVERFTPSKDNVAIFLSHFKCTVCGIKNPDLIEADTKTANSTSDIQTGRKWLPCRQCGGNGGPGGRCPRCYGNGFEPSY